MPVSSLKQCPYAGCSELVRGASRCVKHSFVDRKESDKQRGTAHDRGYNSKWQKSSKAFLKQHPLCVACEENGLVVAAEVVDHIVPHKLFDAKKSNDQKRIQNAQKLFWNRNNWQPLCKKCHDKKTARERLIPGAG